MATDYVEIDGLRYSVKEIKTKCVARPNPRDVPLNYSSELRCNGVIYKAMQFFLEKKRYLLFVREDSQGQMTRLADPVVYGITFGEFITKIACSADIELVNPT